MSHRRGIAAAGIAICATVGATALRSQADTGAAIADSAKNAAESTTTKRASDGPVRLVADLSDRKLTVLAGETAIETYTVAIGRSSKPTPTGTFRIRKIVWNPSWVPPDEPWAKDKTAKAPGEPGNPMKVAKIFFREPDYYIHGTGDVESLGSADSHGCLRMSPDEVAELAKLLMEKGGNPQEEGWFSRVIHLRWKTHTVTLPNPIQLTITG
jgi:lipoprotein-anchoring transpeptidase ErfK/SrfK